MALVHPSKPHRVHAKRELHPAISLAAGFGFMVLVASLIHMLFGLI